MKKIILFKILLLITIISNAQDYNTGIGIRGGFSNGLTIKHFIEDNRAWEGILATRWNGFHITGLYEIHGNVFDTPGLNWYYGVGGHLGSINGNNSRFTDGVNHTLVGIDGILGLEYNFAGLPINLSLDWKPHIDIIGDSDFMVDEGAFSIRFIF